MSLKTLGIASCAALLGVAIMGLPAEAAPKKPVVHHRLAVHRATPVTMASQPRVRVRVAPRSYTTAGTEVLPGQRKFMDYAVPPTYSPTSVIDNTAFSRATTLPGPFDLPGRNNPYPYQW